MVIKMNKKKRSELEKVKKRRYWGKIFYSNPNKYSSFLYENKEF